MNGAERYLNMEMAIHEAAENDNVLIFKAIERNDVETFERIIRKDARILNRYSTPDLHNHRAPIHLAIEKESFPIIERIIRNDITDLNLLWKNKTPILLVVEKIISCKSSIESALMRSERCSTPETMKQLVDGLINKSSDDALDDLKDSKDALRLDLDKIKRYEGILQLMLSRELFVQVKSESGSTPIKVAKNYGMTRIIEMLRQYTPKQLPMKFKLIEWLNAKEEHSFSKNLKQFEGASSLHNGEFTLLQISCVKGLDKAVSCLLDSGAVPEWMPLNQTHPIELACRYGYYKVLDVFESKWKKGFKIDKCRLLLTNIIKSRRPSDDANVDFVKCVDMLLKHDCIDVNRQDKIGNTALHHAVIDPEQRFTMKLFESGARLDIYNKFNKSPLYHLPASVLESILDAQIKHTMYSAYEEVLVDYKFLLSPNKEMSILQEMIDMPKFKEVLLHPVIKSFIELKWKKIRILYMLNFGYVLLFYILIIFYILMELRLVLRPLLGVMLVPMMLKEILQFVLSPWDYTRGIVVNLIEISLIISTLLFILCYDLCSVIVVGLLIIELMILSANFEMTSVYIEMFRVVTINLTRSLLSFSYILVGFPLCFYVTFNRFKTDANNATTTDNRPIGFTNQSESFFKSLIMMMGEFDASDIEFNSIYFYIIFILFIVFIVIIIMNLVTGLAVGDIQMLRTEAKFTCYVSKAKLISHLEDLLSNHGYCFNSISKYLRKKINLFNEDTKKTVTIKIKSVVDYQVKISDRPFDAESACYKMIKTNLSRCIIKGFIDIIDRETKNNKEDA